MFSMKNSKLIVAIVLGVSFLLASIAISVAYYQTKKPVKTVSVVGLAEKDFTSDLIVWNISFSYVDMNMKEAYNKVKDQTKIVKNFLTTYGMNDAEMDFMNISTEPKYDGRWNNGNYVEIFKGYEASQKVKITSKDVEKVEKIIRKISDLYDQNVNIRSYEPEYYYTKLSDLKLEMLSQASQNAKNRAETITQSAGAKLGDLKTATAGVFQITAPNSSEDSYTWGGAFNTSSKQKHVSINMRLTYFVE